MAKVTEVPDASSRSFKVYSFDFDLGSDDNKTLSFNSTLIGIYHVRFYTETAGIKSYFQDR